VVDEINYFLFKTQKLFPSSAKKLLQEKIVASSFKKKRSIFSYQ
jgi:hypothetical protein